MKSNPAKSIDTVRMFWRPVEAVPSGAGLADVQMLRESIESAQKLLSRVLTTCHDCQRWDIDSCELYGEVPKDFQKQAGACPEWRYDGMNF